MTLIGASRSGNGQSATVNSLTFVLPVGSAAGHAAVLTVNADGASTAISGASGTSSWTQVRQETGSGSSTAWLFSKTLTAGDITAGQVVVNFTTSVRCSGVLLVEDASVTVVGLSSDVDVDSSAVNSYPVPTGTATAGATVLAIWARRRTGASGVVSVPSPYTAPSVGASSNSYGSGANTFTATGYNDAVSAGSVGGETGSTGTTSIGYTFLVILPAANVNLSASAALGGTGTLSAAGSAPTASQGAALGGSGTLAGTGTPGYARAAAMGGSGTLAATGKVGFTRAAALSGNGTLGALPVQGLTSPSAYTGDGELQAAALGQSLAFLTSSGSLVGFPFAPAVFLGASLGSTGSLSGTISPGLVRDALLSSLGTLAALGLITPRAADLSGAGYLSTFQQSLMRLGLIVPITYRLGGTMPTKLYLGSNLVWSP
jgi:hypothetical protein